MTEQKHTPTPWAKGNALSHVACEDDGEPIKYRIHSGSVTIGYVHDADDAAFIVRACNAHDELVAVLSAIVTDYLGWAKEIRARNDIRWDSDTPEQIPELYERAADALAKARGEE